MSNALISGNLKDKNASTAAFVVTTTVTKSNSNYLVTVKWAAYAGAVSYHLIVATNSDGSGKVYDYSGITDTQKTVSLATSGSYYFLVSAVTADGTQVQSPSNGTATSVSDAATGGSTSASSSGSTSGGGTSSGSTGGSGVTYGLANLSSGSLNTATFANPNGYVNQGIATSATAYGVVKQSDGKIVVGGVSVGVNANDFTLARFSSAGALDGSYGTAAGSTATDFFGGSADMTIGKIAIQSNDYIVMFGYNDMAVGNYKCFIARYDNTGLLDNSFNNGSTPTFNAQFLGGTFCYFNSGLVQSDGQLVGAGYITTASRDKPIIARYSSAGVLQTSQSIDLGATYGHAFKSVIQLADGSLIAVGYAHPAAKDNMFIAKFTSALALDPTFGAGAGYVTFDAVAGSNNRGNDVVADSAGNLYVAGYSDAVTSGEFVVVKFNSDGTVATSSFGTSGVAVQDVTAGADQANAILLQADGKILLGGVSGAAAASNNFTLIRFLTTGAVDTSFGASGILSVDESGVANQDILYSMMAYDASTVIAVGTAKVGGVYKFAVAEFN